MYTEGSKVINVDLEKEMKKSFLDYSMSVIVSRALPDVRDGLKPVHRRILYTLYEACWAGTIPTATPPCTTHWCVWRRTSPCGIR